ncbi:DivIVA domain-containing protein [Gordonia hankookensis]|uniref:DivIVA domain-containing protein n=1 Tax=Gordonia hankookensis TaxID=589403 RepID=A0ABR7W6L4_9ACTN|nr:DivIVA domain-containing protein [Gordonia hankookensis]MBD1318393.1 DivIVA domain-containing protein [Gordonia hankookensis]NDZ93928.1 DivIVA domain-containing protein [Streptomyces sp. SID11726]NEB25422.1 DivIVA domain-containing protein [Streptomyces sp. SID6673]
MQTILLYLLIMAVVVAAVFAVVWFVFGRGEDLPPLDRGTTLTRLPRAGITGANVRALTFSQKFRGYSAAEVDWAMEKLARELDELRGVVLDLQGREAADLSATDGDRRDGPSAER